MTVRRCIVFVACLLGLLAAAGAGPFVAPVELVQGPTLISDVAYGDHGRQRLDVYKPNAARGAPVIVMVHGGGWRDGDKTESDVVGNKAAHWLSQGFVFVSVNYRLLPEAGPLQQAEDIAAALAFVQAEAPTWGGDPDRLILLGHSAGAHLVMLVSADPGLAFSKGAWPWSGTIGLDSAAYDVPALMQGPHSQLYDDAFGNDPEFWKAASPYHRLEARAPPLLFVCTYSHTVACPGARRIAAAARAQGLHAEVLEQDMNHTEVNANLGLAGAYTQSVDAFIAARLSHTQ